MWGINSVLLVCLGFFIKSWMKGIENTLSSTTKEIKADLIFTKTELKEDILILKKELKDDIDKKAEEKTCKEIHAKVDTMLHKHATTGQAGEVVK
jgi:hypothetical protein